MGIIGSSPVLPSMSVSVTEDFMLTRRRAGSWLEDTCGLNDCWVQNESMMMSE